MLFSVQPSENNSDFLEHDYWNSINTSNCSEFKKLWSEREESKNNQKIKTANNINNYTTIMEKISYIVKSEKIDDLIT